MQSNVLQTLRYADIFDYPLTFDEIYQWEISSEHKVQRTKNIVDLEVRKLIKMKEVYEKDGFYFLSGRQKIVELRGKRKEWSREKHEIAKKTAEKLKNFPWVKMIGITGALAMNNCKEDDDVDFIIITSRNRLWLTRLFLFISCPFLGIKRRIPNENNPKNKICFNLFLDENYLSIEPHNLYLAHEICQIIPLVNKDKTYEKLMGENKWVMDFLPNALTVMNYELRIKNYGKNNFLDKFADLLEFTAYKLQYLYMKPKITNEKISLHQAFFHPGDLSKIVKGI